MGGDGFDKVAQGGVFGGAVVVNQAGDMIFQFRVGAEVGQDAASLDRGELILVAQEEKAAGRG